MYFVFPYFFPFIHSPLIALSTLTSLTRWKLKFDFAIDKVKAQSFFDIRSHLQFPFCYFQTNKGIRWLHTRENWLFPDLPWCAPTNLRSCHHINNKFECGLEVVVRWQGIKVGLSSFRTRLFVSMSESTLFSSFPIISTWAARNNVTSTN